MPGGKLLILRQLIEVNPVDGFNPCRQEPDVVVPRRVDGEGAEPCAHMASSLLERPLRPEVRSRLEAMLALATPDIDVDSRSTIGIAVGHVSVPSP